MKEAIFICCTESYLEKAKGVISSCFNRGGWRGDFILCLDRCTEEEKLALEKQGIIVFFFNPNEFKTMLNPRDVQSKWHPSIMYRLIMFYFDAFTLWDRILYLDTDVLCFKEIKIPDFGLFGGRLQRVALTHKSQYKMKKVDIDYHMFLDQVIPVFIENEIFSSHFGSTWNALSFNSGLIALAPNKFTNRNKQELLALTQQYLKFFRYPDQGLLTLMFADIWVDMGPEFGDREWLVRNLCEYDLTKERHHFATQMLVHPCGARKPWNSEHPLYPYWKENVETFGKVSVAVDECRRKAFQSLLEVDLLRYSDQNILQTLDMQIKKLDLSKPYSKENLV